MMSRRTNRIQLIQKNTDVYVYDIWPKERFVAQQPSRGRVGMPPSKTLACKYGAVLWKIGPECSGFSVSLQNIS